MASIIDIILKVSGTSQARSAIQGVGTSAKQLGGTLQDTAAKTEQLNKSLGNIKMAGAGLALAGAGGIALANSLTRVYEEGARADEKLKSMLRTRGEGGAFKDM